MNCKNIILGFKTFIIKVLTDDVVHQAKPTEREIAIMDKLDVYRREEDQSKRCYLSWRRAHFICILPLVIISVIGNVFNIIGQITGEDESIYNYTSLGGAVGLIPEFVPTFILLSTIYSLLRWHNIQKTTRILRYAWVITLVLSFAPILFPPQAIRFDGDGMKLALKSTIEIVPATTAIPLGAMIGCAIIRDVVPTSTSTTWAFLLLAPFSSLFSLSVYMIILQAIGDRFLVAGTALLSLTPWIFVIFGKQMLRPHFKRLGLLLNIYKVCMIIGVGTAAAWFLERSEEGDEIAKTAKLLTEVWGFLTLAVTFVIEKLFMEIVFADIFLQVAETDLDLV